ncbi:plasmid partitioning/stability family protein [Escherichia coli]
MCSERGELFRNAFISGMALHQLILACLYC